MKEFNSLAEFRTGLPLVFFSSTLETLRRSSPTRAIVTDSLSKGPGASNEIIYKWSMIRGRKQLKIFTFPKSRAKSFVITES